MNLLQKQAELSRTLFEINMKTAQEIFKTQQEDVNKYFELYSEFGKKLPEIRDVTSFVELQREYGEGLWKNVRESGETQVGILRSALEETGDAVRSVFTPETDEAAA